MSDPLTPDEILTANARDSARLAREAADEAHEILHSALRAQANAERHAASALIMCIAALFGAYVAYHAAKEIGVFATMNQGSAS